MNRNDPWLHKKVSWVRQEAVVKGHFTGMHQRYLVTGTFLDIDSAYPDSVLLTGLGFFIAFFGNLTVFPSVAIIFLLFPVREDRTKQHFSQRLGRMLRHREAVEHQSGTIVPPHRRSGTLSSHGPAEIRRRFFLCMSGLHLWKEMWNNSWAKFRPSSSAKM